MGVAEVNNIIVLIPQTAPVPSINPLACWDWYAYLNNMYGEYSFLKNVGVLGFEPDTNDQKTINEFCSYSTR